jgi:hypothetical protein
MIAAVSEDGTLIISQGEGENEYRKVQFPSSLRGVDTHEAAIVVVGWTTNAVYLCNAEGAHLRTLSVDDFPRCVAFCCNGELIAVGFRSGLRFPNEVMRFEGMMSIFGAEDLTHKHHIRAHDHWVNVVRPISVDGGLRDVMMVLPTLQHQQGS